MNTKKSQVKILLAAFEADPFYKSGGLGDVAGSLPRYVASDNYDIRVILPKLSTIPQKYVDKMQFIESFTVPLGWRNQYCGLFELKFSGVRYYFVDNEFYFNRPKVYGEFDDGERIAFFSKAVLESIEHMNGFIPDVLHCNDWHTALTPVFLREQYMQVPGFDQIKTIFTIHNLKFQGMFSADMIGNILGLAGTPAESQIKMGDAVNFMQGALRYSDMLTTVSPSYAKEICTPYYGEHMDGLFNARRASLVGILNGIDYKEFDPLYDKNIEFHFSDKTIQNKKKNKLKLQEELGLEVDETIPMYTIISRLTEQKGLDLVTYILPQLMERKMQLVILGVGDQKYEEAFTWYANNNPKKVAALMKFDAKLSNVLYAASDALLVPSRFEPCGLTQMMAMRYGTLPIVRETGGLKDSVAPYNEYTGSGTGFSFANFNAHELLSTIDNSLMVWYDRPKDWLKMQKQAMKKDYSWRSSAKQYRKLYRKIAGK
ncbi:MAG: glycogen synthase GlgA [Bacillota bacterium]|nr:glycogen synthase GlgA [Bacillota bacterium]